MRTWQVYDEPAEALRRYLTNGGRYPWTVSVRTPAGSVPLTLRDYHDLLTVNEIFCRQDYGDGAGRVFVDIGANVGLAALYFLTRHPQNRVWCYEPDPANTAVLRRNLAGFEDRYTLVERAVTPEPATVLRFVPAGRYGHTAAADEAGIELPAVGIDDALTDVLARVNRVDLVKVDTEGTEPALVSAINASAYAPQVSRIVYEDNHGLTRWG